jgi:LmbE family N-acetylglucosaminyl deacetylase
MKFNLKISGGLKMFGSDKIKILVVGAHYDDETLSAGGTIAKFIKEGHEVFVNIVTASDYTSYDGTILRDVYESEKEGINGLIKLGVKEYKIKNLGFETKKVPFNSDLIESINRSIDIIKPDLVITHHPSAESHPDHINTAKSTLAAGRRCNGIWVFEPLYPSKMTSIPFRPQKYIDISDTLSLKIQSLKEHKSQWEKYPYWEDLITSLARVRGIEIQTKYAECFEIIKDNL